MEKVSVNFDREVIQSRALALVDFWAPWCGPCKMLAPTLSRIEQAYKGEIKVVKVNTEENPELAAQYQVLSLPTVLFFQNGTIVDRIVGNQAEKSIKAKIDGALAS